MGPLLCYEVQGCPALCSRATTQHSVHGLPPHSSTWELSSASRPVSPTFHQTPHSCSVTSHSTHPTLKSAPSLHSPQSCSSSSTWVPSPWRAHHLLRCSGLQPGVSKAPRAPPRLTHHTPQGPDLLWVFDDHSPFHSLCLQSSTRSHHFIPEPQQQVLKPLLHPAAQSSPSGDGGTDSPEVKISSGCSFCPKKALRSQGLGSEPRRANSLPGRHPSAFPQPHPRLLPQTPLTLLCPQAFFTGHFLCLDCTPVFTGHVQEECKPGQSEGPGPERHCEGTAIMAPTRLREKPP